MKLVFVGSNQNIAQLVDTAQANNIQIAGIIDQDYWGNTPALDGVPVIGTELAWDWTQDFVYFVATNWMPGPAPGNQRNQQKRAGHRSLLATHGIRAINLVHPQAWVAPTCQLSQGIFVGAMAVIGNHCKIGAYCQIREQSYVAHGAVLGQNVVLQVQGYVGSEVIIGDNCYLGIKSSVIPRTWPAGVVVPTNTFVKSHSMVVKTPG